MNRDTELESILDDYSACERGEFSIVTLAFSVATWIVKHNDIEILDHVPKNLREGVISMAKAYRQRGELVSQSSTGRAFHNELGARLASLLRTHLEATDA